MIGKVAQLMRHKCRLTQAEAAKELDISEVYLSYVENDHCRPSSRLIERMKEVYGVDVYILAWCLYGNINELPVAIRKPVQKLTEIWVKELDLGNLNSIG